MPKSAVDAAERQVDSHMRTGVPGILAAGDVAFAFNAAAGRHLAVEHRGEALAQRRIEQRRPAPGPALG